MLRHLLRITSLAVLAIIGSLGIWLYQSQFAAERTIEKLEVEKKELQQIVQRLEGEKRVAEVLVTDQQTIDGVEHTTLLFVEYGRNGQPLPPRSFTIEGNKAHIDAMVIKFDRDFVKENDPLRGHSIALFTRIYGEKQSPAIAYPIDEPGQIPTIYRDADPRISQFEQQLWKDFWRLTEDEKYRQQYGVRVAMGQGIWGPFERDRLYTITLESDGGLNLTSEPLKGIYREALKQRET